MIIKADFSEILGFGIQDTVQGIRNATNDWNPERESPKFIPWCTKVRQILMSRFKDIAVYFHCLYPACQRLFMRGFRFRLSLKKWPAWKVFTSGFAARVLKTSRPAADEAPRRTREKTSGTQGTLLLNFNKNELHPLASKYACSALMRTLGSHDISKATKQQTKCYMNFYLACLRIFFLKLFGRIAPLDKDVKTHTKRIN